MLREDSKSSTLTWMSWEQWPMNMDTLSRILKTCACGRHNLVTSITLPSLLSINIWCAQRQNGSDKVEWFSYYLMVLMVLVQSTQLAILRDSCRMWIHKFMTLMVLMIIWMEPISISSLPKWQIQQTISIYWDVKCWEIIASLWFLPVLKSVSSTLRQFLL